MAEEEERQRLPTKGPTILTATAETAVTTTQPGAWQQEAAGHDVHQSEDQFYEHEEEDDEDEFFDNELDDDDEIYEMNMDDKPAMIEQGLFIGSFLAEQNRSRLEKAGITHVLQVAEGLTPSHPQQFKYCNVEVMDVPGEDLVTHFERAFRFIDEAISTENGGVLVHCVAGVSRSSTVCIGWLMKQHNIGYDEAFRRVHKVRPWVMPNAGFKQQLALFEAQGCDPARWRAWRHQHAEPPGAVISLSGLSITHNTEQADSGGSSSSTTHSSWQVAQRRVDKQSSTYMEELGTSL